MNGRMFFRQGAAFGAALALPAIEGACTQRGAETPTGNAPAAAQGLALVNANIVTLDPERPRAQAALVRNGRIALVGSSQDVRAAAGGASMFDAEGRTVVPGFLDAHCHMEVAAGAASN